MDRELNASLSWPTFVVVARASTAVRFGITNPLELHIPNFPSLLGSLDVNLRVRTPYVDEGYGVPIPQGIEIAVRGKAPSLDEAMSILGNVGAHFIPFIALSANAAVSDAVLWFAYDISPDVDRHPYYQQYIHAETRLPSKKRRVDVTATREVHRAVINHPDSALLGAAVGQYHVALNHLGPGQEILALAHLYMATDALTNVALRWLYAEQEVPHGDKGRLARALGVKDEMLRDAAREIVVFQGDKDCYKSVKAASDGFEHGFMPFNEVRSRALATRERTTTYVRSSILTLADVNEAVQEQLTKPPFDFPYPNMGLIKFLRGAIVGSAATLSAEGLEYPFVVWESIPQPASRQPSGEYKIAFNDTIRPILDPGLSFELEGHGIGGLTDHPSAELESS